MLSIDMMNMPYDFDGSKNGIYNFDASTIICMINNLTLYIEKQNVLHSTALPTETKWDIGCVLCNFILHLWILLF